MPRKTKGLRKVDDRPKCADCSRPGKIVEPLKEPHCDEHLNDALFEKFYPECASCGVRVTDAFGQYVEKLALSVKKEIDADTGKKIEYASTSSYDIYGKLVCESCESDDETIVTIKTPETTIYIGNHRAYTEDGDFFENINQLDFQPGYHHTDGWRGYHTVESDTYVEVHGDVALAMSQDCENLKLYDKLFREILDKDGIRWARVACQTSNLFATNVDYWVHKEDLAKYRRMSELFEAMKAELRDSYTFTRTALTGEDLDTPETDRFMTAYEFLKQGMTPAEAVKKVLAEPV